MNLFKILAFISLASLGLLSSAFAIDQVTLTNGQIVQGKVLNDVPNLHVDIQLSNGNTQRFQRSEVASVDRDVPNRVKDREMLGSQSNGFVSILLGGDYSLGGGSGNKVLFDYGAKVGIATAQMGDFARLGFALSFDRSSRTVDFGTNSSLTAAYNDLNLQMLFMRVANSGLYFGPNLGLAILTLSDTGITSGDGFSITSNGSPSQTDFELGFGIGYEAFLTDGFSIGPDVRYEHIFDSAGAGNILKFTLAGNFHF